MWLRILTGLLFCGALCPAAETFRYTAELQRVRPQAGRTLSVEFALRKGGEPYSTCSFVVDHGTRYYELFARAAARLAEERVYYEFLLSREAPRGPATLALGTGMVTRETLKDISEFYRAREALARPGVEAADIEALREISQNDYLGIKPRIVKPE